MYDKKIYSGIFAFSYNTYRFKLYKHRCNTLKQCVISKYLKTAPHNIQVYLSGEDIKYEYEKLALILSESNSELNGYEEIVEKAKEEAAEMGDNAIILQNIGETSTLFKDSDEGLEIESGKRIKIIAIHVFKNDLVEIN